MEEGGVVSISTIHAVKGLEFRVVFVIALEEGLFPLSRAMNSQSEMEEERRLMYVAVTRAEEKIYLTHAMKRYMYGKSNYQVESKFLKELGIVDIKKPKVETKRRVDDFFLEEKYTFVSDFEVGDKVEHPRLGKGIIEEISDDGYVAKINFETFGRKELMLDSGKLVKLENDDE